MQVSDMRRRVALRAYGAVRFMKDIQGGVEDIEGAVQTGQFGMAAFQARCVALLCLSIQSLARQGEIDFEEQRVSFDFFDGLNVDEIAPALALANDALDIDDECTAGEWLERFRAYVTDTEHLLGYDDALPVLRSPEGAFGLLGLSRRWIPLLDELGLPAPLSAGWNFGALGAPTTAIADGVPQRIGRLASGRLGRSSNNDDRDRILDDYRRHLSSGRARLAEFMHAGVEMRSLGPHVWDESGERYLDCGGYGVFTLGHCHPRIVEAVVEQVRTHPTSTYVLLSRLEAAAAETLTRVCPRGLDYVYFGLSGTDAVETAVKLARSTGRRRIIAMENGYHGITTLAALSITGCGTYQQPFLPLLPDVEFVPFGKADVLEDALSRGPEACVVLEPVQGEGGVIIPPEGYLRDVARACRAHGSLLVVDEIQTGLGRLGTWWGVDRESITPDILLVGKALSGGVVPVSAAVGSKSMFREIDRDPMIHASTFSGAPITIAAAKATIEVIEDENIVARAASLGDRLRELIARIIADTCPKLVNEVRGVGLFIAIEWKADYLAFDFLMEMLDHHVILVHSQNAPRVTRLTPPAILTDDDVEVIESAVRTSAQALATR